ncbi:helix-turn-helix domain-containing protein [Enterococcus dongliensis]|uniref:helix-turn-helix domain-containing protein n=1 Tax=Enterococcus dongliensis TaxID=2559925 RepID=UPI00288CB673|nr:helix-turn-helix transcriptional regulator [Enterococcus dongliensis]MDT2603417.1 helix-turn-helix transcriptional regulator [Enterococcus dongliensis]MDT2711075.1 helix-turn-helix transcriptional regulator [Enterococcus dongliensis]
MLKFHLDKILEDNNMTINSFTNLLNEENGDSSKNISRKSITAIANNSAKNIQIPVIERILDFFKIPLEDLLTLETDELKFKFTLLYKNESNFNSMVSVKQVDFTLPSLHLEIFKENNYLESFHFYINMGFDEEVTTKNKGFVNTITFIPTTSPTHKLSDEEKKEFEKRIVENYAEVFNEHLKKISNYIYMLTANDIEDVFKPIIESILNVLKSFYFDDLVISETFYCDISSIIVLPVSLNNNGKKLIADFSIFKQLAEFPLGVYSDFSKNKTVTTEIEIQKES